MSVLRSAGSFAVAGDRGALINMKTLPHYIPVTQASCPSWVAKQVIYWQSALKLNRRDKSARFNLKWALAWHDMIFR